jgi:hypothetical protein
MYTDKQKKLIVENLEAISDHKMEELYNQYLDEVFGEVAIACLKYSTSRAFREVDPTAYRCGMADWIDCEITNGIFTDEIDGSYYFDEEVDDLLNWGEVPDGV